MAEEPDRLRQNIESTRATLTRDVDLLAEKASPRQAARRRWTSVRERVMGSAEHGKHAAADTASSAVDSVEGKAHDVADAVRSAPQAVATQAQGNPIAAGIIAFGVGLLAATLIPVTEAERRAGQELKEHSGDLTDRVKDMAGDVKDDLAGSMQQAVGEVKSTAQDAVETAKQQAQSSAQDAKQAARNA